VVFVPGGGRVSRDGVRPGDGVSRYDEPVAVTAAWAQAVVMRGALALTYDKRTCAPSDAAECRNNPTTDLDAEGPVALARDVDAACAALADVDGFDGRVVLWAHGQGVAVALASRCAASASALVLVAPVPRRIDNVMVETLEYLDELKRKRGRAKASTDEGKALLAEADGFRNAAGSLRAMFESMDKGQFSEGARVKGATLPFWKAWIELTDGAEQQALSARAPRVVVQGQWDLQFTPDDRRAVAAWGDHEGVTYLRIEKADHHLLTEGTLTDETVTVVLDAVWGALDGAHAGAG
jgi:pimeloyl-ACP methyl ester carboxylesterase